MESVIAYVDGYNLYHGLRAKGWKRFYWLNIAALARQLLKPDQTLASTKYFTTVVKHPDDKRRRQAVFLEALQTLPDFRIFYGQFLEDLLTCRKCGHTWVPRTSPDFTTFSCVDALQPSQGESWVRCGVFES